MIKIWSIYSRHNHVPDHMLGWLLDPGDPATKAGRTQDLLSVIERGLGLDPVFNSPIMSAPAYIDMLVEDGFVPVAGRSLMLGSLGAVSAIEHDMIAGCAGIPESNHIDLLQQDARERYMLETGNETFTIQDAASTDFEEDSVDIVIADYLFRSISLQISSEPDILTNIMQEVYRVLRPGGRFLIIDQLPQWAVQNFDSERYAALLSLSLRQSGFDKHNRHEVQKYRNRETAYRMFPRMNSSDLIADNNAIGFSATK